MVIVDKWLWPIIGVLIVAAYFLGHFHGAIAVLRDQHNAKVRASNPLETGKRWPRCGCRTQCEDCL